MKQILMSGANINYASNKGFTALHFAIQNELPEKIIKFLIKYGADPHIENRDGKDACELGHMLYPYITLFSSMECKINKGLRTTYYEARIKNKMQNSIINSPLGKGSLMGDTPKETPKGS